MSKILKGYIYFDGLELIVYYHILETIKGKPTYYLKTPKNFQLSELLDMCFFINRESLACNLDDSLLATNISNSVNNHVFNAVNEELNVCLYFSTLDYEKNLYLANSLFFLNQPDNYELVYSKDSHKYFSDLFTRENVESDNHKLIGAIHYFNFIMFHK